MFETIILPAMSLGLSAASIPGPLQAYLLNITLRYGWRRGILVILSPLITDGPVILLTVFVLGQLPEIAIQIIRVAGGGLLLYIAWGAYQQLRSGASFTDPATDDVPEVDPSGRRKGTISPWRVLATASGMNLLSPGPYLFWGTVNGPLLLAALEISGWAALGMLVGFYGVFLGGMTLLVVGFNQLGTIDDRLTRIILRVTIALLVWFGTGLIAEAFSMGRVHQMVTVAVLVAVIVWQAVQRVRASATRDIA